MPWFPGWEAATTTAAKQLGVKYDYVEVDTIAEIETVLKRLRREQVSAVRVVNVRGPQSDQQRISGWAADNYLPTIGDPEDGFLLSYGDSGGEQITRKAAEYVAKILGGAKPSDLPVEQSTDIGLAINLKTARAIGMQIPESVLLQAVQVIR